MYKKCVRCYNVVSEDKLEILSGVLVCPKCKHSDLIFAPAKDILKLREVELKVLSKEYNQAIFLLRHYQQLATNLQKRCQEIADRAPSDII